MTRVVVRNNLINRTPFSSSRTAIIAKATAPLKPPYALFDKILVINIEKFFFQIKKFF